MSIEDIEHICCSFADVQQEIKWKSDLVFMVGRKMFCLIDLEAVPPTAAFKVGVEQFEQLTAMPYHAPAPYFARHNWVTVADISKIPVSQWKEYLATSYALVRSRLSKKVLREMGE